MVDANGNLKVVGSAGMKKQEKKASDTRASITAFCTGLSAGNNGPNGFLMKGKRRNIYNPKHTLYLYVGCGVASHTNNHPFYVVHTYVWSFCGQHTKRACETGRLNLMQRVPHIGRHSTHNTPR